MSNIFLYREPKLINLFFNPLIKTNKFIFLYLIKKFIFLLNKFLFILPKKSNVNILHTDNLILSTDTIPEKKDDFYFRNQFVLSRSLSKNENFLIIGSKSEKLYLGHKKLNITYGSLKNFISALSKELKAKNDYPIELFNFNLKKY